MRRNSNLLGALLILGLLTVGRAYCEEPAKTPDTKVQPPAQAESIGKDASTVVKTKSESVKPLVAGKVLETMDAGRYTYMLLEKDGRKGWVAVPGIKVKVGQEVKLNPGTEMGQFTSKTLNRTFNQIVFTTAPSSYYEEQHLLQETSKDTATAVIPAGHPAMTKPAGMGNMAPLTGKVVETMDGGGYTYICLEKDGKKTWAAVPVMKAKVGESLELLSGTEFRNFTSKTLNRTFESIIFSAGPVSSK